MRHISLRALSARSVLFWLVTALMAAELAHIIALQIATFHPMPWADEWDTLVLFRRAEEARGSGLGFLFFPHNEHRIAIPRLITLFDLIVARGTGAINLATLLIVPALTIAVCWFALRRRVERPALLTACLACLLFSGGQMSNFVWGFQTQVWLLYFFSLLAFCFVGKAVESRRPELYFAACVLAICACLSQAGGLLVFPVIIFIGISHARRAGRAGPVGVAIIAALMVAFYLWGPGGRPSSSAALVSIRDQALFGLSFLGSPLATISSSLAIPAGIIALALSVLLIIRYTRSAEPRLDQTVAVAICLFVPGLAVAAALSRIHLGIADATESRFVTPALFLWAGLLVGFWPSLKGRPRAFCAVFVGAYSIVSHLWIGQNYSAHRYLKTNAEISYVAGVKDTEALRWLGPVEQMWVARPFVLRHALAPFSGAVAQAVGRRLSDVYEVKSGFCVGQLDGVLEPIAGHIGYRLYGWALAENGAAPAAVLLVQRELVVGIGRFLQDRPDVLASNRGASELKVGFVGVVRDLAAPVRAYVPDRGRACLIVGEVLSAP